MIGVRHLGVRWDLNKHHLDTASLGQHREVGGHCLGVCRDIDLYHRDAASRDAARFLVAEFYGPERRTRGQII